MGDYQQVGVDVPADPTPTTVDLAVDESTDQLSTLSEDVLELIKQRYVAKDEVEKQVGKVKSTEQRRAEEERQARLKVERERDEVIAYNQQWQELYDKQAKARLETAEPDEKVRFYQSEAEKAQALVRQAIAAMQAQEDTRQGRDRADEMWKLACQEASEVAGVTLSPDDPGALQVREQYEKTPKLPFRLVEYASKQKEKSTHEANKVPLTPPAGGRRLRIQDIDPASPEFEKLYQEALAGKLK